MKLNFNNDDYIEINVIKDGTVGIPYDCALEVKLHSETSIGTCQTWVDGFELQSFIKELQALNKTLKSSAVLTSESPGELHLEIKPVDNSGHFAFIISIGRQFYIQTEVCEAKAMNAFPLDAMAVSEICLDLVKYFEQHFND